MSGTQGPEIGIILVARGVALLRSIFFAVLHVSLAV